MSARAPILALLAASVTAAAAAQEVPSTYHQRQALVGHESFAIQIVGLGDGETAQKLGIQGGPLLREIERRARAAGVVVEDLGDDGARALLEIKVILAYEENLELAVWSTVAEVRQTFMDGTGRVVYASIWSSGGYVGAAILARAKDEIAKSIASQVDRFLADYQAVRREQNL